MIRPNFHFEFVVFSIFATWGALSATQSMASGGGSEGGGAGLASYTESIGKRTAKVLTLACQNDSTNGKSARICTSTKVFLESVALAKFTPIMSITGPDGQPRDAGNDGKSNIQINIQSWNEMARLELGGQNLSERKIRVIVHEYSVLAGLEDNDRYPVSGEAVELLKQNFYDLKALAGDFPTTSKGSIRQVDRNLLKATDTALVKALGQGIGKCKMSNISDSLERHHSFMVDDLEVSQFLFYYTEDNAQAPEELRNAAIFARNMIKSGECDTLIPLPPQSSPPQDLSWIKQIKLGFYLPIEEQQCVLNDQRAWKKNRLNIKSQIELIYTNETINEIQINFWNCSSQPQKYTLSCSNLANNVHSCEVHLSEGKGNLYFLTDGKLQTGSMIFSFVNTDEH